MWVEGFQFWGSLIQARTGYLSKSNLRQGTLYLVPMASPSQSHHRYLWELLYIIKFLNSFWCYLMSTSHKSDKPWDCGVGPVLQLRLSEPQGEEIQARWELRHALAQACYVGEHRPSWTPRYITNKKTFAGQFGASGTQRYALPGQDSRGVSWSQLWVAFSSLPKTTCSQLEQTWGRSYTRLHGQVQADTCSPVVCTQPASCARALAQKLCSFWRCPILADTPCSWQQECLSAPQHTASLHAEAEPHQKEWSLQFCTSQQVEFKTKTRQELLRNCKKCLCTCFSGQEGTSRNVRAKSTTSLLAE